MFEAIAVVVVVVVVVVVLVVVRNKVRLTPQRPEKSDSAELSSLRGTVSSASLDGATCQSPPLSDADCLVIVVLAT